MSFTKAFITGLKGIATAGNDLERLKYLPQKVEGGEIINFEGTSLIGVVEGLEDVEIFDKEEVLTKKRVTGAFLDKYFAALDNKLISKLGGNTETTTTEEDELLYNLLELAEKGDKRAARPTLKELKEKWFALDPDDVEDAIDDIKDAIDDKDAAKVKDIYEDMEEGDNDVQDNSKDNGNSNNSSTSDTSDSEDDELILDLEEAVEDDDKEGVLLLLKELEKDHPRYKEFESFATGKKQEVQEEADEQSDEEWIEDWKDEIEEAIEKEDLELAKELLEEFKEEFGEDEPEYKEYSEKYEGLLNPSPKKERTRRRGRK